MVLTEQDLSQKFVPGPESLLMDYTFIQQDDFYNQVDRKGLPRNISYVDFSKKFSGFPVEPDMLIVGHLHHQKESHKDGGVNMVNYIATAAEGKLKGKLDPGNSSKMERSALEESLKSFSSVVAEQPIAEVSRREMREYEWKTVVLPDGREQMRLVSSFGDMDSILEEALRSSQSAEFERERYQANLKNYRALQQARENRDYRPFVEFSPSPELTPEAKARGYFGMDALFIYKFDKDSNKEVIEQRWLKAQKKDYRKLLGELEGQEYLYLSDAGIMNRSRFIDQTQEKRIHQFIDKNNGKFVAQPELEIFRRDELQPRIRKMVEPIIQIAAEKMISGIPFDKELEELEAAGAYLQHLLREKIKELLGVDKTRITISQEDKDLIENDSVYLAMFVERNKDKMPLGGCGGSNDKNSNGMTTSMAEILSGEDGKGRLEFTCPHCGYKDKRERNKLKPICKNCGGEICK